MSKQSKFFDLNGHFKITQIVQRNFSFFLLLNWSFVDNETISSHVNVGLCSSDLAEIWKVKRNFCVQRFELQILTNFYSGLWNVRSVLELCNWDWSFNWFHALNPKFCIFDCERSTWVSIISWCEWLTSEKPHLKHPPKTTIKSILEQSEIHHSRLPISVNQTIQNKFPLNKFLIKNSIFQLLHIKLHQLIN